MTDEKRDTSQLTPANENPWYVLMTLYGEGADQRNARAWANLGRAPYHINYDRDWSGQSVLSSSSTDRAKLLELFQSRIDKDLDDLPADNARVQFEGVVFDAPIDLTRFAFRAPVSFESCRFEQSVCFDDTLFDAGLTFRNVTFAKGLSAKRLKCRGAFKAEGVRSEGKVDFAGARFGQTVSFEMPADHDASFEMTFFCASFDGYARFGEMRFPGYTIFQEAEFKARAMFSRAAFEKGVSFRGTVFRDYAYFNGTVFKAAPDTETHHINFTESRFELPPTFREARFVGEYPNLAGAILHERTIFTAGELEWPKRRRLYPRLEGVKPSSAKVAAESAAILRAHCAKQSLPEEEHFFFRREMHHAARAEPFWRTAHIYVFEAVSDFGYSIARPANLLLALWCWSLLFYTEGAGMGAFEGLGYSFANMFKFFGLHRTYFDFDVIRAWPGWLQWVSGAQTVLAFLLLFFLGLGLRTRFRLR